MLCVFASGSIFGNKFLTPVGIKTLFPIFENSLCGKELVVETQTFEQRKFLPFILWPNLLNKFFSFFGKEEPVFHLVAWQTFWLKGEVGGKPPFCFLVEVANSLPSFFPYPFATSLVKPKATAMAGRERTDPNC